VEERGRSKERGKEDEKQERRISSWFWGTGAPVPEDDCKFAHGACSKVPTTIS